MQEKYGQTISKRIENGTLNRNLEEQSDTSTDSEEEDDNGVLVSEALDAQIQDTLEAIRKKDPRVYDKNVTFFSGLEESDDTTEAIPRPSKPMYLSEYHRQNLLRNDNGEELQGPIQLTYSQQQESLKNSLVREMHLTAGSANNDDGESPNGGDDFLVAKPTTNSASVHEAQLRRANELDVGNADKDPEAYLTKFMSGRAWVSQEGSKFHPFESDEEEDQKAEEFEEAYNLRFEDPAKSNEKLTSHARDAAARHSVRKEKLNSRKKAREEKRAAKETARQVRDEERARLRKLKVGEAEEKIQKIKEAAGVRDDLFNQQDWSAFLDEGWDDSRWEEEMKKRFGEDYYADRDFDEVRGKVKKPKWEEDININDLLPDFDIVDKVTLTDGSEAEAEAGLQNQDVRSDRKQEKKERHQKRKESRQERRKIERLIDEQMQVDEALSKFGKKHAGNFRYRETSPLTFGLTAQDILLASDSQLNQYAGLKKMAAFRDSDKKRKDKKHLGKKARLRQWRKDTFGDEHGPTRTLAEILTGNGFTNESAHSRLKLEMGQDIDQRKHQKKRVNGKPSSG